MADSRFFKSAGVFTLGEIARLSGAEIIRGEAGLEFSSTSPLNSATAKDISFLDNPKYISDFTVSKAGACFIKEGHSSKAPVGMALLKSESPYHSFAKASSLFYPDNAGKVMHEGWVSPKADIHDAAKLGENITIEPFAVICEGAEIGNNSFIGSGSYIGRNVVIGENTFIAQNVTIKYSLIGRSVIIHPGCSIGQDGFGFAMGVQHIKVPQLGRVIIEDEVEIGANSTIDRGAGPDTVIGLGTKIDNLVQIGHNVQIGKGCIIVSQTGISGSTIFGDYVIAGGQTGFGGHIKIGSGAQIAAQAGVTADVEPAAKIGGTPAVPLRQYHKQAVILGRMATNNKDKEE